MTMHDQTVTVFASGVLMNDMAYGSFDPVTMEYTPPGPLTSSLVSGPANGSLSFRSDGSFTYTPGTGFVGSDSFTYQASDGTETSNTATVSINVMNSAPSASDDSFMILHDQTLNVFASGVLMNDSDMDGDPITPTLLTSTSNGTLTFNSDGSFTYVPNTGYVGSDSFTYNVSDGIATSNTATASINVMNSAPSASDDSFMILHDQTLNVFASGVLMNDSDMDGDPITPTLLTSTSNGTLTFNSDGSFTYVPNASYEGNDSFTYTVSDGIATSPTATVTINVYNNAPIVNDDFASIELGQNQAIDIPVVANDFEPDGDTVTIQIVSNPSDGGTATVLSNLLVRYDPPAGGVSGSLMSTERVYQAA